MTAHAQDTVLYTVPEVAEILRLSESTIRRMCQAGRLPAVQLSPGGAWRINALQLLGQVDRWTLTPEMTPDEHLARRAARLAELREDQ